LHPPRVVLVFESVGVSDVLLCIVSRRVAERPKCRTGALTKQASEGGVRSQREWWGDGWISGPERWWLLRDCE
jgi:hypothetical protein